MTVIGITGPSGAGKGAVSKILSGYGAHIIDADAVYRDCITPPSDCLEELVRSFGRRILTGDGSLNRPALASLVFGEENKDKLLLLNKITHKYVVAKIRRTVSSLRAVGADACVIDAPLLIEAGLTKDCDITLAVLADKDIRIKRISERDGIDKDKALERISSQMSDEYYTKACDYTVFNNGELSELAENIKMIAERGGMFL